VTIGTRTEVHRGGCVPDGVVLRTSVGFRTTDATDATDATGGATGLGADTVRP
jgi:hypothetical protein